ncbi:hypothetical protein QFC22_006215 [Naganishia vaughanmartiniae]|uniref:Uncharacterized protein n=1 Tax=Naganishia vaughanmartiniae TaxID=1424756 RepID=A0ACC2WMR7_9TREE|nr:hypothetical protein QFC22_006215 [Naganishia vaughanmartiniae]
MPAAGLPLTPSESILTNTEIAHLSKLFVSQGVNKIRLTGGEPTLRPGLHELLQEMNKLRADGLEKICMTSNGLALHRKLDGLVTNGLTHLNLRLIPTFTYSNSLDTLDEDKFERITRRKGHSAVMKTLDTALSLLRPPPSTWQPGLQSVKINNVLTRSSNLDELVDFVRLTQKHPISVRFIEFMPFSGNKWDKDEMVPYDEALGIIRREFGADNVVPISNEDGDGTSKRWRIKGWKGEIGFISSMSDHFCGTCNRLRITADGNLKVCLFDNTEVSLRDVMRTSPSSDSRRIDDQLMDVIGIAVGNKKAKHAGMDLLAGMQNRSMVMIGG